MASQTVFKRKNAYAGLGKRDLDQIRYGYYTPWETGALGFARFPLDVGKPRGPKFNVKVKVKELYSFTFRLTRYIYTRKFLYIQTIIFLIQ